MLMGKRRFGIAPGTRLHRALLRLTVIGARLFLAVDVLLNGPPGGGGRFGAFAETVQLFRGRHGNFWHSDNELDGEINRRIRPLFPRPRHISGA
jgi:hypothetical protein